jgi:zinc protease
MVFNTPAAYSSKEAFTLSSLAEVMSIKLIEQLREEKGGVYGVSAYSGFSRIPVAAASFTITFPCAPDNADTLSKAVLEELKKIITNGVSAEDLEKIKEQQKRKLEVETKQNRFWMDNIYDAFFYGTDPAEILNKQKLSDELTSKMIQDAAKKYINLNGYIIATLKPEKQDEKPLKGF